MWAANLPARAQPAPDQAQMLAAVSEAFPAYLKVDDLVLAAPSVSESGGRRREIYKFDVAVSGRVPLFSIVREVGPFVIVVPTLSPGESLRFTGVLDSTLIDGRRDVAVGLDQDIAAPGRPLDRFGRPALIAGDPQTQARLAQVSAGVEAEMLAEARRETEARLQALRTEGEARLQAERARNAADLLDIIAAHAEKRGALIAEQRQQISELETGLAIERQNLERQVAAAENVQQLQARLAASLGEIAAAEAAAINRFTEMRRQRVRLLDALPKSWAGDVTCVDDANANNRTSATLEIVFDRVLASGFPAGFRPNSIGRNSFQVPGVVAILDDTIAFPLHLKFTARGLNNRRDDAVIPDSFSLTLSADGRMRGSEKMAIRWDRAREASLSTCSFELSG